MPTDGLRDRIEAQFSYRGERADIWRVFDHLLETDAFLNLGYSAWYQSHLVGSPQRRLVDRIGRRLAARLPATRDRRLLDVGSGRGGPAIRLADQFGFDVTGVDLVGYNVRRARANAAARGVDTTFLVGDATDLPIQSGSLTACTAIDALVYLPDREAVVGEIADALEPGGVLVFSDLVAATGLDERTRDAVARFGEAWDMPSPGTVPDYERALESAGFDVITVEDISAYSVRRFRKWTALFRWLHRGPAERAIDRALEMQDLDPVAITRQIEAAHEALPALRHALVVAERRG